MIKMIWAVSANGVIGDDGKLPWKVPAELAHFKRLTDGATVVMGRKTWESLPIKPLRNRHNIVVTRTVGRLDYAQVTDNPFGLLNLGKVDDIWIIGGRTLYDFFMPYADELHISSFDFDVIGDVVEPLIPEDMTFDFEHDYPDFRYEVYSRKV